MLSEQAFYQQLKDFSTSNQNALKDLFRNEIKPGFLIKIESKVINKIGISLLNLYDFSLSSEKYLTGSDINFEYDICKYIVGVHHANTIFLTAEEVSKKEKSPEYQEEIVSQVVKLVKLRKCAGQFFRNKSLMAGERYAYYPVPYLLYTLCVFSADLINQKEIADLSSWYSTQIIDKAFAALTLLENSLLDSAYMPCRTIIELFVKTILLKKCPEISAEADRFAQFVLDKSCVSQDYSQEFLDAFNQRTVRTTSKADYLHYGFVDALEGYHDTVDESPYSVYGILNYLKTVSDETDISMYSQIEYFYKMCHGYSHGNGIKSKYPLLHYFEISLILGETIPRVYSMLCEEKNVSMENDGAVALNMFREEYSLLKAQYEKKSTELFDLECHKYNY